MKPLRLLVVCAAVSATAASAAPAPASELLSRLEGESALISSLASGDAGPALLRRLRALSRDRVEADKRWNERVVRRVWIGHLVVEHAISEESVADRLAELDRLDEGAVAEEQRRFKSEAVLWELFERLPAKGFAAALRAAAKALPVAAASPAAATEAAASGFQLTWEDIEALIRHDTAVHPLFWDLRPDGYRPR